MRFIVPHKFDVQESDPGFRRYASRPDMLHNDAAMKCNCWQKSNNVLLI